MKLWSLQGLHLQHDLCSRDLQHLQQHCVHNTVAGNLDEWMSGSVEGADL